MASRMLRSRRRAASRAFASVVLLAPNRRSNTCPRVGLHRQRCRRRTPGDRGVVGAAVARTIAGQVKCLEGQFERRQLRRLSELLRGDLIHRNAGMDIRPFGLEGGCGREPRRLAPWMRRAVVRVGRSAVEAAHHHEPIPKRRQRLQNRRELQRPFRRSASNAACSCPSARRLPRTGVRVSPRARAAPRPAPWHRATATPSVAPRPRSTVRRGICFLVMIIALLRYAWSRLPPSASGKARS